MKLKFLPIAMVLLSIFGYSQEVKKEMPPKSTFDKNNSNTDISSLFAKVGKITDDAIKQGYITPQKYDSLKIFSIKLNSLTEKSVKNLKAQGLLDPDLEKQLTDQIKNTNQLIEGLKCCIKSDKNN